MNRIVKAASTVLGTASILSLIFLLFAIGKEAQTIWEWLFLIVIFAPSVAVTLAAAKNPSEALTKQILVITLIVAVPTIGVAITPNSSAWDDASPLVALIGMMLVTLPLSLWALGAVVLERRSIYGKRRT